MDTLIVFFFLSLLAHAETVIQSLEVEGKTIQFKTHTETGALLSPECFLGAQHARCNALQALAGASFDAIEEYLEREGGASPGALLCRYGVKGQAITGFDSSKNEFELCRFKDGSMISSGSLYRAAQ